MSNHFMSIVGTVDGRKSATESTKRSEKTSGALFILRFYPQDACGTKKKRRFHQIINHFLCLKFF
jgi:hypothetical protein